MEADIASRTLSEKVVLLCLVDLESAGATPVHTAEMVRETRARLDAVEADTLGRLSEAELNRSLNRLEADEYVEQVDVEDTSPVGKGRPSYALAVESAAVTGTLADDDAVGRLADRVAREPT